MIRVRTSHRPPCIGPQSGLLVINFVTGVVTLIADYACGLFQTHTMYACREDTSMPRMPRMPRTMSGTAQRGNTRL